MPAGIEKDSCSSGVCLCWGLARLYQYNLLLLSQHGLIWVNLHPVTTHLAHKHTHTGRLFTADGEECEGLFTLHAGHTLQGVILAVHLGAHVQAALHLPPAEGGLGQRGRLGGVPLGGVWQVGAPVEGFAWLHLVSRDWTDWVYFNIVSTVTVTFSVLPKVKNISHAR